MGYIALHHSGESDQSGAFAQLTKLPGGMVVDHHAPGQRNPFPPSRRAGTAHRRGNRHGRHWRLLHHKGARQKFRDDIALPASGSELAVVVPAMTGYIAKGIAILRLGIVFVVAAVRVDPQDASGLDGALKALAALPFGEAILLLIGVGLSAYGLYSFARARLARL